MKGYATSFAALFEDHPGEAPVVTGIEIPLIQRDYAQGRGSSPVREIRNNFLGVLHDAATGGEPVGLDFVYGEVDSGTLRPLDGQQRLTTLFLLHWYLAFRTNRLDTEHGWGKFSYATRPSARLFCERLMRHAPPDDVVPPSAWITDQEWYLYTWDNDPTIQSMLTVIDAIHERFAGGDAEKAWERVTDPRSPAISFHLLPIDDMGSGEDLYIKMNSRGKPLTPFENFKARFEKTLEGVDPDRARAFAHKVDGSWSNLLWPIHGGDNIVDDEFIRYIEFITEICEWREDRVESGPLEPRTRSVFVADNQGATAHLDFLFDAFDTWNSAGHAAATFQSLFATNPAAPEAEQPGGVVLFGDTVKLDLFEACCHEFGDMRGRNRVFTLSQSLLLYAVLLHKIHETTDFPRRLRILRNLIEASEDEIRRRNMPKLLKDLHRIVIDGTLEGVATFNQFQVEDERLKREFFEQNPELEQVASRLEDNPILRGSLVAFELDAAIFSARAEAFDSLFSDAGNWPLVTGALLSTGEYQRRRRNPDAFQFGSGSNENAWRDLLTGTGRSNLGPTRAVLAGLLDHVAHADEPAKACLANISHAWLKLTAEAETFDWRYYLVKYDCMRQGDSGIYYGAEGKLGYSLAMLNKQRLTSWHRDPYLLAISLESGVGDAAEDPWFIGQRDPWFIGQDSSRSLCLERSRARIGCTERGLTLQVSSADEHAAQFVAAFQQREDVIEVDDGFLLRVRQVDRDGTLVDAEDRVEKGAGLLRELAAAGL